MTAIVLPQPAETQPSGRGGIRLRRHDRADRLAPARRVTRCRRRFRRSVRGRLRSAHCDWSGSAPGCSFSRGCGSRIPSASSCSRWICGSLRACRPGDGPVWASSPSMRTRCCRPVFALPAGLGDMAIGVTAPWIILALVRQPGFAASATFIRWNVLGILDLIVAISIGTVSAFFATGAPGEISTAPMATLPLLLIPAFLVPLFLMLHTAALMQSRQLIRGRP